MSSPEPTVPDWARLPELPPAGLWGPPEMHVVGVGDAGDDALAIDPVAEAHAIGYQEGIRAGRDQARAELASAREAFGRAIAEVGRDLASARHRAELNLHALGMAVGRWLMQREVAHDPAAVEPLIRRAVALLPAGSPIEIQANSQDIDILTNALALTEPDGRPIPVHWITDASLERGSFRLVSPERIIDGRADVALRTLYERLAGD